ncbi:MAG: hypothetical protein FWD61_12280 [Phycisphaerales bacterium]|nr:hypothetical protein [Phycisphaerales bacterium]
MSESLIDPVSSTSEAAIGRAEANRTAALARVLSAAGVERRLEPDADTWLVIVEEPNRDLAKLVLAKRKKDVEDDEEMDDEEEEEEDLEDEEEDEDFDDEEDEDDFEEEFDDDDLDDDDDDIFYDDDDDE